MAAKSKAAEPDHIDVAMDWFLTNPDRPLFTQSLLLRLGSPRLSSTVLQNWANRGVVSPKIERSATRRLYSPRQVLEVCLVLPLVTDMGMGPSEAFKIIAAGVDRLIDKGLTPLKSRKKNKGGWPEIVDLWFLYDVEQITKTGMPRGAGWEPIVVDTEHRILSLVKRAGYGALLLQFGREAFQIIFNSYLFDVQEKEAAAAREK